MYVCIRSNTHIHTHTPEKYVLEEDWTTYPYPEKSLQYGDGPYETKSHIIPNYYKTNSDVIPNYYPTKTQNPANANFKEPKDKYSYW